MILQALFPNISLQNISNSDDTKILLQALIVNSGTVDVHHAGTAMRFLTAYFSIKKGFEIFLTGSSRMQERPIGILVDALKELGADIEFTENEGFPPLNIKGKDLSKKKVSVNATISSQYISALMLIAPSFPEGLEIVLEGKTTSVPYIEMTLSLLNKLGIDGAFSKNKISIPYIQKIEDCTIAIESDWSSASYFYSLVALSKDFQLTLKTYFKESLQGDSALVSIYERLGVKTIFNPAENSITLSKIEDEVPMHISLNLSNTPDIAQTIAVSCFGLNIACTLTGLHTLKIKETNRLLALQNELKKLGATIIITEDSLELKPSGKINNNISIDTYQDHRMAMAFAPLALKTPITIEDSEVVSKSYPNFWEDMNKTGILVDELMS